MRGLVQEVHDDDHVFWFGHVTRDMGSLRHVSEQVRHREEEQLGLLSTVQELGASPGDSGARILILDTPDSQSPVSVSALRCRRYSVFRLR